MFGRPRDIAAGNNLLASWQGVTKGYTDHEHLNEQQLIHMNGRIYDFNVGRFLSVDPFLQFPENSQSANPYSYILNNPMSGTDPTGYKSQGTCETKAGGIEAFCSVVQIAETGKKKKPTLEVSNGQQNEQQQTTDEKDWAKAAIETYARITGEKTSTSGGSADAITLGGATAVAAGKKLGTKALAKGAVALLGGAVVMAGIEAITPGTTATDEEMEALAASIIATNIAAHEKEQAAAISRVRTADGGIVLYHGTDVQSAIRLLNGEPLSAQIAAGNKIDGLPGFYLATDYDDAAFFATRRGDGAVIQFIISNKALGGLNANGAYFQKIPVGGFRADGYEYLVPPQAFGTFNSYRKTEDIVATP